VGTQFVIKPATRATYLASQKQCRPLRANDSLVDVNPQLALWATDIFASIVGLLIAASRLASTAINVFARGANGLGDLNFQTQVANYE
jgi:hypothetical protein